MSLLRPGKRPFYILASPIYATDNPVCGSRLPGLPDSDVSQFASPSGFSDFHSNLVSALHPWCEANRVSEA